MDTVVAEFQIEPYVIRIIHANYDLHANFGDINSTFYIGKSVETDNTDDYLWGGRWIRKNGEVAFTDHDRQIDHDRQNGNNLCQAIQLEVDRFMSMVEFV